MLSQELRTRHCPHPLSSGGFSQAVAAAPLSQPLPTCGGGVQRVHNGAIPPRLGVGEGARG